MEEVLLENRAARRQMIFSNGYRAPKRPFNNRPNRSTRPGKHSRSINEIKKKLYAQLFGK